MSGRILVVDDVATNRMILHAKLSADYFEVIQAESGAEAIGIARRVLPDLILLDVMMPGLDGFETCRRLKADAKTAHIPVVMVTALTGQQDRLHGLECGADDFLSRPVSDLALIARVRNLLRSKFMVDELRLRDRTRRELGLGEAAAPFRALQSTCHTIALLPGDTNVGADWQRMLADASEFTCIQPTVPTVLESGLPQLPDLFVVHACQGPHGDGLRLVSHLKSRPSSRQIPVILVVPPDDPALIASALDLGASDCLVAGFEPAEFVLRLECQLRKKRISDRLRENFDDTLRLAVRDSLTGLYNRRYAKRHIARIAARAAQTGKGFALMLLDIDRFKSVNDQYGHATGDLVLTEFSRRIKSNLRGVDLVSRLGGEEFLIAMPDTTESQARRASERLRDVIESTVFRSDDGRQNLRVTVSIGVTLVDSGSSDVDALIDQADRALYGSKSDGRNMVTLFNSAA